ncbi:methyl-accepting chemotaxis protein [Nitrospira sp. M1]
MSRFEKSVRKCSITAKLIGLCVIFGVVPMTAIGFIGFDAAHQMEEKVGGKFESVAKTIADKIDRNLFERYGDAQIFARNEVAQSHLQWGSPSMAHELTKAMNHYVATAGVYYLTIMVDTEGYPIAVNSTDAAGSPIPTAHLLQKNYRATPWFQALSKKNYTVAMPFTTPNAHQLTGTYIEDIHVDTDVKDVYAGDDGLTIGFSAPVVDQDGNVIAYWSNRTKFALVEHIIQEAYQELKAEGFSSAELTLLDGQGRVLVDYDPIGYGTERMVHDFEHVILKLNLAESGVEIAQRAVAGQSGYQNGIHARKQIVHAGGYTHLQGALGYPGMNWSVLVRIAKEQAAITPMKLKMAILLTGGVCLLVLLPLAWWVGHKGTARVKQIQGVAQAMTAGDYSLRVNMQSSDEVGQLANTFNHMADRIQHSTREMSRINSIVEHAPINIIYVNHDWKIQYMNPASRNTLKTIEAYLSVTADQLIGHSLETFHNDQDYQQRLLDIQNNPPGETHIHVGPEILELLASPIYDATHQYLGAMVAWRVMTQQLALERQIQESAAYEKAQAEKLKDGVAEIASIATSLASAAEELNTVSRQMGGMAEETSNQAHIVSGVAEEVSKNIQSVAIGSEEMSASIQEISNNTTNSARVATEAVTAVVTANATVGKLGQSSAEIGSIIKVINSIAEQTNLLALNATIEAARAGEAGKGFAVVANEVKDLAKETKHATEHISHMIETIQADTKGAVDAIAQIHEVIQQVHDFQNTVASAVEEQTVTTNEMSRHVFEASKGGVEIASNIAHVAQAATSTNEGTQQTKAAAEELAKMAANLQLVVGKFT